MNLRIINKTGLTHDTEIWVGDTQMKGVTDIKVHFNGMGRVVEATIQAYVAEIDTVAEADDPNYKP